MKARSNAVYLLVAGLALSTLVGCTSMPATRTGFLSDGRSLSYSDDGSIGRYRTASTVDPTRIQVAEVQWRADPSFTAEERTELAAQLQLALYQAAGKAGAKPEGRPVVIRAAITRVETVSPVANVVSTLVLFVPLDRGGAAVEIEALDADTQRQLAALSYAHYAPLTEFGARFERLAPAGIAFKRAAEEFVAVLEGQSMGSQQAALPGRR